MIRVMLVDDQALVRDGLQMIVGTDPDIDIVGTAENGAEVLERIPAADPDLVLMDLKMPVMNGVHTTREIRQKFPEVVVLILTTYNDDEWVFDAVRAGAAGYILKDAPKEEIIAAIKHVASGGTHVSPDVAAKLYTFVQQGTPPNTTIAESLNDREREILSLLANGLSNADIAERVALAEGTVRNYVSNIFAKLGVADRTQAAALAWRHGLVNPLE